MRNYASFCGNWPVVPDGFESLRSLHFFFILKPDFTAYSQPFSALKVMTAYFRRRSTYPMKLQPRIDLVGQPA
jgi:hypothetical protein